MEQIITTDNIIPIPALTDNYIWTLLDPASKKAYVVDPGDAHPVIATLNQLQFTLAGILVTHHHADHSAGIRQLLEFAGNITVIASYKSPISTVNHRVKEGDDIHFSDFHLKAMEIPGHTLDHTAYYNDSILFSGDTLFSAGCGKIFEGTPEMMYHSLNKLMKLNDNTKLYCGHEYTLANLKFAQTVEPTNQTIAAKIKNVENLMALNHCSLPSTLGDEITFNPFLRCHTSDMINAVEQYTSQTLTSPLAVFTALRTWKNHWR